MGPKRLPALLLVAAAAVWLTSCHGRDERSGDAGGSTVDAGELTDGGRSTDSAVADAAPDAPTDSGVDPACEEADSNGFFSSCSACPADDCDTIDTGSGTRYACGCSGGCPCGLRCGSHEIAPGVTVSNVCVR